MCVRKESVGMAQTMKVADIVYERASALSDEKDISMKSAVTLMCIEGDLGE